MEQMNLWFLTILTCLVSVEPSGIIEMSYLKHSLYTPGLLHAEYPNYTRIKCAAMCTQKDVCEGFRFNLVTGRTGFCQILTHLDLEKSGNHKIWAIKSGLSYILLFIVEF